MHGVRKSSCIERKWERVREATPQISDDKSGAEMGCGGMESREMRYTKLEEIGLMDLD